MFDEDDVNVWEFIRPELFRSRNLAWGSIYIDLESGKVNFVQRWKYESWSHREWALGRNRRKSISITRQKALSGNIGTAADL
jgi:hypothetical protein